MKNKKQGKPSFGFSLIELLISISLMSWIGSGVFFLVLVVQKANESQMALSQVQQNYRLISDMLRQEINAAGFMGCPGLPLPPAISSYQDKESKAGTHGFQVQHAANQHVVLLEKMTDLSTLLVSREVSFSPDDELVISDCQTTERLIIEKVMILTHESQKLMTSTPLIKKFSQKARLSTLETNYFYVSKTERQETDQQPVYALYKKDSHHRKLELIDHVTDLMIQFTENEKGYLSQKKANEITNWANVVGVSIQFSLTSTGNKLTKTGYLYAAIPQKE